MTLTQLTRRHLPSGKVGYSSTSSCPFFHKAGGIYVKCKALQMQNVVQSQQFLWVVRLRKLGKVCVQELFLQMLSDYCGVKTQMCITSGPERATLSTLLVGSACQELSEIKKKTLKAQKRVTKIQTTFENCLVESYLVTERNKTANPLGKLKFCHISYLYPYLGKLKYTCILLTPESDIIVNWRH